MIKRSSPILNKKLLLNLLLVLNGFLLNAQESIPIASITPSEQTGQDYSPWLFNDYDYVIVPTSGPNDPNQKYVDITLKLTRKSYLSGIYLEEMPGDAAHPITLYAVNGTLKTLIGTYDGLDGGYVEINLDTPIEADALEIHKYGNNIPKKIYIEGEPLSDAEYFKITGVILFEPLEDRRVGDDTYGIGHGFNVRSNLGNGQNNPIVLVSSDTTIISLEGSNIKNIKKAGVVTITASQSGDNLYSAPANVVRTLIIRPRITDSLYVMNQDTVVQMAKLKISGKATVGKLNLKDTLVTAASGTYDILTRNTVSGEIEKISSNSIGGGNTDSTLVSTTGSYSNPTWLSALSWNKLTGVPSTLSGLGITDAAPKTGSVFYIQNQFSSPQSASFYLNGEAIIGSDLNPTAAVNKPPFDLRSNISNGRLGAVLGRLPEGNTTGDGTYLGIRGFNTQVINGVGQKGFSFEHAFYGYVNNSINFYRGGHYLGGFMTFNTDNNTEKMRIGANGNILINTTTDDNINKLQVNGNIKSLGTVETNLLTIKTVPVTSTGDFEVLTRNSVTGAIEKTSFVTSSDPNGPGVINDANFVHTSGNETITGIKTFNGNIGMGTLDPKAHLDIATPLNGGKLGAVLGRLSEEESFLGIRGYTANAINVKSFSLEHSFHGNTNSSINFYRGDNVIGGYITFNSNDNSERMRISKPGNLLIGTTTDDNINKLQVNGNIKSSGIVEGGQFTIKNTPVTSTEGFDVLTRNSTTGIVEKAATGSLIDHSTLIHNTGDEMIAGLKTFTNNTTFGDSIAGTSALFSSTLTASNFSGSSSGTNTGDETQTSIVSKLGFSPANESNTVHKTGDESISGIKIFNGNIGIGTSTPGIYQLAVKGTIRTQAIKVDPSNWADYVFAKSYKLPLLSDVEKFINKNQHLPEIPSEAEVKKNGIELGEMNALLLKKIEELTLYMIEKDKEVKELKTRLDILEKKK